MIASPLIAAFCRRLLDESNDTLVCPDRYYAIKRNAIARTGSAQGPFLEQGHLRRAFGPSWKFDAKYRSKRAANRDIPCMLQERRDTASALRCRPASLARFIALWLNRLA